jgi:transketolase
MSDGELDEGSTWEAAMSAAHHRLDNLIGIVDVNNQQADGPSTKVLNFEPLATSGRPSAGTCSGSTATTSRRWSRPSTPRGAQGRARPRVIICDTLMGKGVPFLEAREMNHFLRVDPTNGEGARRARQPGDPHDRRSPGADRGTEEEAA